MAYVEYETSDHVAEAVKMMDGGKMFSMYKYIIFFDFRFIGQIYSAV